MMATGLLSENPAEFARDHDRRWLVSAYEAGDVVLHDSFAVSALDWAMMISRMLIGPS